MAGKAAPQAAITRLDPRKIPPGKWQVIPTYPVAGTVHVDTGHLIQGKAPVCISTIVAPPCQPRAQKVLRNGHLTTLTPAEAKQRAAMALARVRALRPAITKQRQSGNSGNTGNTGNSGTPATAAPPHRPAPRYRRPRRRGSSAAMRMALQSTPFR